MIPVVCSTNVLNSKMSYRDKIISEISEKYCRQTCRRVIHYLQSIKDTLSGDDSVLVNSWDEICVQIQFEQSFYWDAYETTMNQAIRAHVEALPNYAVQAIWLQTEEGINWSFENEEAEVAVYIVDDIVDFIL